MTPSTPAPEDSKSAGAVVHPSPVVIVGRVLLLCAAGLALAFGFRLAHARDRDRLAAERSSTERYVCPMHPEVVSRVPGECPICRMALERAGAVKDPAILERSGTIDTVAKRVVTQIVRAPAWLATDGTVTAVLHKDDLVGLAPGERAQFFGTASAGEGMPVRLSSAPPVPWDAATVQLRFAVERPAATHPTPQRQDTGWLQVSSRPRELIVVPSSAVLYSGTGAYVLAAAAGSHSFTRRDVELGRILDSGYGAGLVDDRFGTIVVLSGLKEGEQVIGGDAFFLDAERRLQASHGNPAEVTR